MLVLGPASSVLATCELCTFYALLVYKASSPSSLCLSYAVRVYIVAVEHPSSNGLKVLLVRVLLLWEKPKVLDR